MSRMKFLLLFVGMLMLATLLVVSPASASGPTPLFSQGFEIDINGWNLSSIEPSRFSPQNDAVRVASGTHGVTSRTGAFHAEAQGPYQWDNSNGSAFTPWGASRPTGYTAVFPVGGYVTSVDVYLDPAGLASAGTLNDTRIELDSAESNSTVSGGLPGFLRDFVFNGGYYNDTDGTGSGPRFVFTASNNGGRGSAFPKNPARSPFSINATGWYTFQHHFYNIGGKLACDLGILDSAGHVLKTWTLSDASDIIGVNVGGNRYGWFLTQELPFLAFDNSQKVNVQSNVLTVSSSNMQGWTTQADSTATVGFVYGPSTPPLGAGSGQFNVGSDGDSDAEFRQPAYASTLLSDLTVL